MAISPSSASASSTSAPGADALAVRPAQQRRSRESWLRVLDAGVAVLEEGGGDGFTIAAVCERAGVTPPAVYRRAPTKDALFLAVFEHGLDRTRATEQRALAGAPGPGATPEQVVRHAVGVMTTVFTTHRDFLRAAVVISATNEVVRTQGVQASTAVAAMFERLTDDVVTPAQRTARAGLVQSLFGALVLRTGFGPGFAEAAPPDDEAYAERLADLAVAVLVPPA